MCEKFLWANPKNCFSRRTPPVNIEGIYPERMFYPESPVPPGNPNNGKLNWVKVSFLESVGENFLEGWTPMSERKGIPGPN